MTKIKATKYIRVTPRVHLKLLALSAKLGGKKLSAVIEGLLGNVNAK